MSSSAVSGSVYTISIVGTCKLVEYSTEVQTNAFSISLEKPLFMRVVAKRKDGVFRLSSQITRSKFQRMALKAHALIVCLSSCKIK